jgi:hypothetical protein
MRILSLSSINRLIFVAVTQCIPYAGEGQQQCARNRKSVRDLALVGTDWLSKFLACMNKWLNYAEHMQN